MFSLSEIFHQLGWKEYLLIVATTLLIILPNDGARLKTWFGKFFSS